MSMPTATQIAESRQLWEEWTQRPELFDQLTLEERKEVIRGLVFAPENDDDEEWDEVWEEEREEED